MPRAMSRLARHRATERHYSDRASWLRAGVLGANDGLISTAALVVGVAAADSARTGVVIAGIAGLTSGALSMAAGEYVSVSSQLDAEQADLAREGRELAEFPEAERDELAEIYRQRGLSPELSERVADELSARQDRLAVHAREELGIDVHDLANPWQAAAVSATSFIIGSLLPVLVVLVASTRVRIPLTMAVTVTGLATLGTVGARLGGADPRRAAARVVVGGLLALVIALGIGRLTGAAV